MRRARWGSPRPEEGALPLYSSGVDGGCLQLRHPEPAQGPGHHGTPGVKTAKRLKIDPEGDPAQNKLNSFSQHINAVDDRAKDQSTRAQCGDGSGCPASQAVCRWCFLFQ